MRLRLEERESGMSGTSETHVLLEPLYDLVQLLLLILQPILQFLQVLLLELVGVGRICLF